MGFSSGSRCAVVDQLADQEGHFWLSLSCAAFSRKLWEVVNNTSHIAILAIALGLIVFVCPLCRSPWVVLPEAPPTRNLAEPRAECIVEILARFCYGCTIFSPKAARSQPASSLAHVGFSLRQCWPLERLAGSGRNSARRFPRKPCSRRWNAWIQRDGNTFLKRLAKCGPQPIPGSPRSSCRHQEEDVEMRAAPRRWEAHIVQTFGPQRFDLRTIAP